jgi:hypothetical protein
MAEMTNVKVVEISISGNVAQKVFSAPGHHVMKT